MNSNKLKKYFGKMVCVKLATNKEFLGKLTRGLEPAGRDFVEAKGAGAFKYVEMKVWETKDLSQTQASKSVFKIVLQISKIKQVKVIKETGIN